MKHENQIFLEAIRQLQRDSFILLLQVMAMEERKLFLASDGSIAEEGYEQVAGPEDVALAISVGVVERTSFGGLRSTELGRGCYAAFLSPARKDVTDDGASERPGGPPGSPRF